MSEQTNPSSCQHDWTEYKHVMICKKCNKTRIFEPEMVLITKHFGDVKS